MSHIAREGWNEALATIHRALLGLRAALDGVTVTSIWVKLVVEHGVIAGRRGASVAVYGTLVGTPLVHPMGTRDERQNALPDVISQNGLPGVKFSLGTGDFNVSDSLFFASVPAKSEFATR
ncbi:hypothetical protein ACI3L1_07560 [Deinococcus sp. SM5_A1]|uniref:hypothetical protein n=1 Tax=Deinococcus sp. SM5_A1 TaxID=3379094 RepID=UPI0038583B28